MPNYMTTAEVAEELRAPIETVRYWRAVGKGPASFKIGRRVLYDQADVEAFVAQARASSGGNDAA
jgi:excisionase family DNA binding protein